MPPSSRSLAGIGAAHIDETARLTGPLHPAASNPVNWVRSIGGVAFNLCHSASQWVPTSLIAAIGNDTAGQDIQAYFRSSDIAADFCTLQELGTGRYSVLLDQQGELIVGLAATDIAEQLSWDAISHALSIGAKPDVLAFDANLSATTIKDLCAHKPVDQLAALAVSPVKSMRLADHSSAIDLLFVNRAEAAMLTGLPRTTELRKLSQALFESNFHQHVLTDGSQPALVRDKFNVVEEIPIRRSTTKALKTDGGVNGAGDALAGATLAGLLLGNTLPESVLAYGLPAAEAIVTGDVSAPVVH